MREWNHLEDAARYLEEGIELAGQARKVGTIAGWLALALCRQAQGDAPAALDAIERARQEARAFDATDIDDRLVDFFEALILHKLGITTRSHVISRPGPPGLRNLPASVEGGEEPARLDVHLQIRAGGPGPFSGNKPEAALALLDSLLPEMAKQGRINLVIEIELQRALSLLALGDQVEAHAAFKHALTAAEPGGWVRIFIDEGEAILNLLQASRLQEGELKAISTGSSQP
jgi:LuxR family maltose regulon positive regulatory protein